MLTPSDFGSSAEEMDDRGGPVPWIPGENPVDMMPKLVHRRAKRIIPDDEKDDKYWEKRKRNNMAAKRSRENKRQMEVDIRNKVSFLEEENALLHKEVLTMKTRFGIPLEQSVLTAEERAQCLQEVKNAQAAQAEGRALKLNDTDEDVSSTSPGLYPVSMVGHPEDLASRVMSDPRSMPDPRGMSDLRGGHSPANGQMNGQRKRSKVKEEPLLQDVTESSVFVPNGPTLYGPFSPPMMWGPNAGQHHSDFTTMPYNQQQQQHHQKHPQQHQHQHQHQQQQQQQQQQHHHQNSFVGHQTNGQNKLPSINNAFHEKTPDMGGMYGGRYNLAPTTNVCVTSSGGPLNGNQYGAGDGRMPYDYYMAAAYSQGQAIYSPAHSSPNMVAAPADLSLAARTTKQHHQDDTTAFLDKSSLPDEAQIPQSMSGSLGNTHPALTHQRQRGMDSLMAVSLAGLGQPQQDMMFPGRANTGDSLLVGAGNDPMAPKDGHSLDKEPSGNTLQESDELKLHIQSLQARMDHMQKLQTTKQ